MLTKAELESELKEAMRAGDKTRRDTMRMVLSAVKLAEVDRREPLGEEELLKVLKKEANARRETIQDAEIAARDDLVENAQAELEILEGFLPEPLTNDEIASMAHKVIEELEATGMEDMGRVMGDMMSRVAGRAEGKQVSDIVRRLLQDES